MERVLNAYNELKNNHIDLMLLKNIILLNKEDKYKWKWLFVEEGNIQGYDYFIMVNNYWGQKYLTAYIELENKLTEEQTINCPISISFNDIGARNKYCIGIDRNHIWNDEADNHLDLDACKYQIREIIDWLVEKQYK